MTADHSLPLRRRDWLHAAGALGLLPLTLGLSQRARASGTDDYRALICIFLQGGNDAFNTVLATDAPSWQAYQTARAASEGDVRLLAPGQAPQTGAASLHARLGGVLPIRPRTAHTGRNFALHPCLREAASLFQQGRLGIVANLGAVVGPTSKADWLAGRVPRPPRLFSHNDQQAFWQTLAPEGAQPGWGGRLVERAGAGVHALAAVSTAGRWAWTQGDSVTGYQMPGATPVAVGSGGRLLGSAAAQQTLQELMRRSRSGHLIEQEHAAVADRSLRAEAWLRQALPAPDAGPWGSVATGRPDPLLRWTSPVSGTVATNPIAAQLQTVARFIAARQTLGVGRQVFFVGLNGFDTHAQQAERHADLLAQLDHALAYLDRTLQAMGVDRQVTTFTASDFGRTLASNGNGTDHGWGGHALVMGGSVRGGEIHGRFPRYGLPLASGDFDSEDLWRGGVMIPSLGLEPFIATLGRWLGVPEAELPAMLPQLARWPAAQQLLDLWSA
ncbi:DUF1501 domain-containing protein [Ideonella livida]|uniref:DUF1501 domain-containing protein n=1 Tax=Ideonella livida TaxID=2707176 RepID=A0A7C9PIC1_9BURK|nr:DUF1501 domain-containing protein [Ideonella livida]NDY91951.1 DUF1501 domain-containing protein [Ideonella livida]